MPLERIAVEVIAALANFEPAVMHLAKAQFAG
jgi:hypothetical protein